ncbi:DNA polymerase III subunit delta [Fictibacillus macauensis ZFHKF-1]|uniref:DNA polymerase III subunit delta n=1 Tax=Fictibacillus macauensis ZFHKF-1 TaxID=1196324 RepID=I8J0G3_9BACL|nr:DNA polymerase III subunit delta [Fictibacillus macauensis]EIT85236.1 DNA polymerase III subunit delta [Fictibacillus macauensis ZFHKF-1]
MSITPLKKHLKSQQFQPFYVLYGTETYVIDEALQAIVDQAIAPEDRDFNYSAYDYLETPIQSIVGDAETVPFMGERKVVVVKNALFLTGAKEKSKVEHDLSTLETYVADPPPFTLFVFIVPAEKLDERKKLVKAVKKRGELVMAQPLNADSATEWVKNRALELGVQIDQEAAHYLTARTGNELHSLEQEMEKLSLYVGKSGMITVSIVESLVPRTLEDNVFDLIDRIVHKKIDEALRIFYDLMKQNEEPIKLLSLMARQFRIIFSVKELSKKGYGEKQMATSLKLHPYVVKLASKQARMFAEEELLHLLDGIAEADYAMKTGKMEKRLIIELFMLKMAA